MKPKKMPLLREIYEEAGIKVKIDKPLDKSITPTGKRARWYLCSAISNSITPGDDLSGLKWVLKS